MRMLLIAMVAALAATLAALIAAMRNDSRAEDFNRRLQRLRRAPATESTKPQQPILGVRILAAIRPLFSIGMRGDWGVTASAAQLAEIAVGTVIVILLIGHFGFHLRARVLSFGAVLGFFLGPRIVMFKQQRRARALFAELLPDAIDMIVRMVRAGLPIAAAVRTVGQEAPAPLNTVFAEVASRADIGIPLDQALAQCSVKLRSPDFRFLVVTISLQQETGGNLASTLESFSEIIRKRRAVQLKANAALAEVRTSGLVLGSVPFFVAGALLYVSPNYLTPLFAEPLGHVILGLAGACLFLAWFSMRAMVRNALKG